jgi:hypothetical protein
MDIKAWLETSGMGEHWEKFESNKIDESILKEMTEDDLKDIGIDALGDRRKIAVSIKSLQENLHANERIDNIENRLSENRERAHISISIISIVTGVLGFISLFDDGEWDQDQVVGVVILFAIPPIVLGVISIMKNAHGKGMGIAGLVLGIITLVRLW